MICVYIYIYIYKHKIDSITCIDVFWLLKSVGYEQFGGLMAVVWNCGCPIQTNHVFGGV